ncbi:dUTP diphosphatase [Bacillus tamaricis]|uniref:dUTP diphosphatase n=1 Tax=Evansella tamaricis TaxID=2069301 RepID=A0ABS6JPR9_9BACI|nr:dUTP diphosphatase [Evansella tamaricis]
MDFSLLFNMQRELDAYIESRHGLEGENLLRRKLLAFHVELAELANETRCFKFWSEKEPSEDKVILEEYVDGIHFMLSIGLELNLDNEIMNYPRGEKQFGKNLVPFFEEVMNAVTRLQYDGGRMEYLNLCLAYLNLGCALGFSSEQIMEAYMKKNSVNYDRQNDGY